MDSGGRTGGSALIRERSFYRMLLVIALPVALKAMLSRGVIFLDNLMVGSLGDVTLSAVALANQTTSLFSYVVMGIGGGASVLVSQYWGKRDMARIKSVFSIVFMLTTTLALAITLFVGVFPGKAMRIFSDQTDIIAAGIPYISVVCYSYLLFALSETVTTMLRCVELVQVTLWSSLVALGISVSLNYVLIFGRLGLPALGAYGAAISTVIARTVELGIVAVYFFGFQTRIRMRARDFLRTTKRMLLDFARHGLPIVAGDLQWGLVLSAKAAIIGRVGAQMVAAYNITDTIVGMASIFASGLGSAACILVGKAVGEGDRKKARQISNTLQALFACSGAAMCALLFCLRIPLVSLYKEISPQTAALAVQFLGIASITYLGTFYHATCFTGINRGAGDGKFVFKVDMICGWLIVIPASYLAAHVFRWPLRAVFLCLYIDQCFKWSIAFLRLRGNRWIRDVTVRGAGL
jgi:putative MATE family efflux protein